NIVVNQESVVKQFDGHGGVQRPGLAAAEGVACRQAERGSHALSKTPRVGRNQIVEVRRGSLRNALEQGFRREVAVARGRLRKRPKGPTPAPPAAGGRISGRSCHLPDLFSLEGWFAPTDQPVRPRC